MQVDEIIKKVRAVLTTPGIFFKDIKKETDVKPAFWFYALLSLLSIFLLVISAFIFRGNDSGNLDIAQTLTTVGPSLGVSYLLGLGFSFIWARIAHLWLSLFKPKGTFRTTYQILMYSQTPSLLFGWIPTIGLVGWIYEIVLFTRGTELLHGFSRKKAILVSFIPRILVSIALFFLASYLASTPFTG